MFKTSYMSAVGVPGFALANVDTSAKIPVGTVVKGYDDTQGEGEFIYLPGAANVAAGDFVVYDLAPGAQAVTRLAKDVVNNTARPVAVALTAIGAGSFGWYQISGVAIGNTVAATAAGVCMATATVGSVGNTADAGDQILGARISTAVGTPAAGQSYITLNRPCMQSQIT
jgi:hypothetical protein